MMKLTYFLTFFILVFSFVLTVPAQEQTSTQEISWYAVSRTAMKTLLAEEKNRLEWEAELDAKADKTPEEWLLFINLALRSGHDDVLIDALKRYEKLCSEKNTDEARWIVSDVFRSVTEQESRQACARKFAETLGLVFYRVQQFERSLPLLKLGEQSKNGTIRNSAAFTRLKSLVELHRWTEAELQFLPAIAELTDGEIHVWLQRIHDGAVADNLPEIAERCARKLENLGF
ncbi:MAG: hypothetical protein Q4C70_09635 [Planctomycetia bacterium]|nr:hypothetical protein [Planctomycetia bacterium]